ncbi:unnamed protein product, partial [Ectocarpus sp. 13 AM-2016]
MLTDPDDGRGPSDGIIVADGDGGGSSGVRGGRVEGNSAPEGERSAVGVAADESEGLRQRDHRGLDAEEGRSDAEGSTSVYDQQPHKLKEEGEEGEEEEEEEEEEGDKGERGDAGENKGDREGEAGERQEREAPLANLQPQNPEAIQAVPGVIEAPSADLVSPRPETTSTTTHERGGEEGVPAGTTERRTVGRDADPVAADGGGADPGQGRGTPVTRVDRDDEGAERGTNRIDGGVGGGEGVAGQESLAPGPSQEVVNRNGGGEGNGVPGDAREAVPPAAAADDSRSPDGVDDKQAAHGHDEPLATERAVVRFPSRQERYEG